MRLALLISVPIVVPAMVAAQQLTPGAEIPLTPPGFKMLRFDEDYSYLTNQANRTDLSDPVKYIPLRQDDPLWYVTFGGELRERDWSSYSGGQKISPRPLPRPRKAYNLPANAAGHS